MQLLGLLLPKYVPDDTILRQPSWVGVVHNGDALVAMLQQHVIEPLLQGGRVPGVALLSSIHSRDDWRLGLLCTSQLRDPASTSTS